MSIASVPAYLVVSSIRVMGLRSLTIDGMSVDKRSIAPSVAQHMVRFPRFDFIFFDVRSTIITYRTSQDRKTISGSLGHHFCRFQHSLQRFRSGQFSCKHIEKNVKTTKKALDQSCEYVSFSFFF